MVILLIGVTGSGKTTVGKLLAAQLRWRFYEGDDFHPPANIEKLRRGVALNDEDRRPWLEAIRQVIHEVVDRSENAVIGASALKESYRHMLQIDSAVAFVHLKADAELIRERLKHRAGHFMNPRLIESQFEILEEPDGALQIDAGLSPDEIVRLIRACLSPP